MGEGKYGCVLSPQAEAIEVSKQHVEGGAAAENPCGREHFLPVRSSKFPALFLGIVDPAESFFEKISVKRICGSFYRVQF
jgi:hypothetical protein